MRSGSSVAARQKRKEKDGDVLRLHRGNGKSHMTLKCNPIEKRARPSQGGKLGKGTYIVEGRA
jgi:hypothetical protein